jgi:cell division ATPase FtsA
MSAFSCGVVAGLIHDIPTVKELVTRIMSEAEAIIETRLLKMQKAHWSWLGVTGPGGNRA